MVSFNAEALIRLYVKSNKHFMEAGYEDFNEFAVKDLISFEYDHLIFPDEYSNAHIELMGQYELYQKSRKNITADSQNHNYFSLYDSFFQILYGTRYLTHFINKITMPKQDIEKLFEKEAPKKTSKLMKVILSEDERISSILKMQFDLPETERRARILEEIHKHKEELTKLAKIIDTLYQEDANE